MDLQNREKKDENVTFGRKRPIWNFSEGEESSGSEGDTMTKKIVANSTSPLSCSESSKFVKEANKSSTETNMHDIGVTPVLPMIETDSVVHIIPIENATNGTVSYMVLSLNQEEIGGVKVNLGVGPRPAYDGLDAFIIDKPNINFGTILSTLAAVSSNDKEPDNLTPKS